MDEKRPSPRELIQSDVKVGEKVFVWPQIKDPYYNGALTNPCQGYGEVTAVSKTGFTVECEDSRELKGTHSWTFEDLKNRRVLLTHTIT